MFFRSVAKNIPWGLSTDQACKVGAMTEGNIPVTDRKKQLLLYLLPGYSKNLLKEKLNCLNSYELRIGKSWKLNEVILEWLHFAMASLSNGTTLLDNGFWNSFEIAFLWIFHKQDQYYIYPSRICLCLHTKLPSFLKTGYSKWESNISCTIFS